MAELKTQRTTASVADFFDKIEDEKKRADAQTLSDLMQAVTGAPPVMWGSAIVGFGNRRLKYDSGRELDWMILGFSPRKASFSLYLPGGLERLEPLLARLGSYKVSGGCLHVKRLDAVDLDVLREIVESALTTVTEED